MATRTIESGNHHAQALLDATREALLMVDGNGTVLFANPAAERLLGHTPGSLRGRLISDVMPSLPVADLPERPVDATARDAAGQHHAVQLTPSRTTESGEPRIVLHVRPARVGKSTPPSTHEALLESMDGIVWEADAQTWAMLFVSAQAERILGFPVEDWYRERTFWQDHIHPEDRQRAIRTCLEHTQQGDAQFQFEYRMLARDGRTVWLRDYVTVVQHDGAPTRLRGIMVDITAQKAAESRLDAQLRVTRVLANEAGRGGSAATVLDGLCRALHWDLASLWVSGDDGKLRCAESVMPGGEHARPFIDACRATVLSTGEGLVGRAWQSRTAEWIADPARALAAARVQAAVTVQLRCGVVFPVVMGERTIAVVELYALSPRARDDDLLEALAGIGTQVGQVLQRQRAETDHRRGELQLRLITDALPVGVALVDGQLRYRFVNQAWATAHGRSPDELLGQALANPDGLRAQLDGALAGKSTTLDRIESHADGSTHDVRITCIPQRRPDGSAEGVILLSVDMTDVRRAEDQLRRTEEQLRQTLKMQALGRLAGGVAHDFNNLLTAIIGHTELLLEGAGGPEDPLRQGLDEIKTAGERAAALTRQLLAYSRKQRPAPRPVDLNSVVADLDRLLRRLIGEHIELRAFLGNGLRMVKADPNQLEQVILNLAINARDAMPEGGKLTMETSNFTLVEEYSEDRFTLSPGDYVMLAISDTGQGMDEETRTHLFEPFFTTKEEGSGTGLGLSVVHTIVKSAGGQILAYSEQGIGTSFKVYLPAMSEQTAKPAPRPTPPAKPVVKGGSETILLVEDEETVRGLMRKALTTHGYNVIEAPRGEDALRLASEHKGSIHLLVTDVVLGGLSGRQVAEQLRPLRPELKVLFISGYTDEAIVRHGVLELGSAFLNKPFAPSSLAVRVRELLDGNP